jgi:hypothetical protein
MAEDNKGSNSTALFISFIAGLAVGAGAILFLENTLNTESEDDYESEQLFV